MTKRRRILIAIGTRPEAIKLSPVIRAAQQSGVLQPFVVRSGQQGELVDSAMASLNLTWDLSFEHVRGSQSIVETLQRLESHAKSAIETCAPSAVIVQGDTSTAYAFAVVSALLNVPIAHVEAGLRTYDSQQPFPEEIFRRAISSFATWHFAPTPSAAENLVCERIPKSAIWMTGNTVVDAAQWARSQGAAARPSPQLGMLAATRVLVTCHRRENFESGLGALVDAVNALAIRHGDIEFVVLNHSNPRVHQEIAARLVSSANVRVCDPLPYIDFMKLLAASNIILTDSGGLQEEAASLGIPTVVVREVTERMELINSGLGVLSRPISADIQLAFERVLGLTNAELRQFSQSARHLFGDGTSGSKIVRALEQVVSRIQKDVAEATDEYHVE